MSLPTQGMLVAAELRKLSTRLSFRLSLGVLAAVSAVVPLLMLAVSLSIQRSAEASSAGVDVEPFFATSAISTVLSLRNFFLFRAMLIAVVAVSVAGEFVSRTLREDLVRPVSRTAVISAKLVALYGYTVLGTLVPMAVVYPVAIGCFGVTGPLVDAAIPWAYGLLGDLGFCTLLVAIAVTVRSVPGTIVGVFVYWFADLALWMALWALDFARAAVEPLLRSQGLEDLMPTVDLAIAARPWLPSSAFNLGGGYSLADGVEWESALSLVLISALSYAWAVVLMNRVDVD